MSRSHCRNNSWKLAFSLITYLVFTLAGCSSPIAVSEGFLKPLDIGGGAGGTQPLVELPDAEAAEACQRTGAELQAAGYLSKAIRLYERSLAKNPKQPGLYHQLAVLYDRTGNAYRSEEYYQKAIKHGNRSTDLLNDYGYFHLSHGRASEAEPWFRKAVASDADYRKATINLAHALALMGEDQESLELFTSIVGEAAAYSNLGAILAKQGRSEDARRALQKAQQLNPELEQPAALLAAIKRSPIQDGSVVTASYETTGN